MISSEMPEILGMSDRIMVMHEGHVSGFLDRAEATQEKIMELAASEAERSPPGRRRPTTGRCLARPAMSRRTSVMANQPVATAPATATRRWALPTEASILLVLVGIALLFEILGWIFAGRASCFNPQRLMIIILQVSIIGLLAIGVTQVIITGGIDLSSGSVVGLAAMVAASLAQIQRLRPRGLSRARPTCRRSSRSSPACGRGARRADQRRADRLRRHPAVHRHARHDGDRPRPRALVHRGPADQHADRPQYTFIGPGTMPVLIFVVTAIDLPHRAALHALRQVHLRHRRQHAGGAGLGDQRRAAPGHRLHDRRACWPGSPASSPRRAASGQAGMGVGYELDAIAAAVIGGTSLSGGIGRISGTVIGTVILGIMISGFTFLGVDAYIQDIVKGVIIVAAVAVASPPNKRRKGRRTAHGSRQGYVCRE